MKATPAAIYARISSDDGTALGVARQETDCRQEAERRNWVVADHHVFVDNDVSASNGKQREHFVRMLRSLRSEEVSALVVWDIDRLTRTPRELEDFIDLADAHGIALASVGGDIDLSTEQGRMMARMKGTVARYEVEQSSRRLRRKLQERAEMGKSHGRVAYGYRREPLYDDAGRPVGSRDVLDPEQAAVLREACERVLSRESLRSIIRDFNARGLPTPRGNRWDGSMLRQLLLRERNVGNRVHRGQVLGKGDWEPIFDAGTFDRLRALLSDPSRRTPRGKSVKHLLTGIALCGLCSTPLHRGTGTTQKSGKVLQPHYRCPGCNRIRRNQHLVDELVSSVVVARLSQPDGPDLLGGDPKALKAAMKYAEELQARLDLVTDEYAEGKIGADQLRRISARLRPQIEAQRAKARAAAPSPELAQLARPDLAGRWESLDIELKRAVIDVLMTVTILPSGRGVTFDPTQVKIEWKGQQ
ncbi:MAG: recombinase family protein [Nocardioidaceae bacterium]|nr:recombinase family protein [Nocardioidaceae bacterium]